MSNTGALVSVSQPVPPSWLLTPFIILALLATSAAAWFAMTDTVDRHKHEWKEKPSIPLSALSPEQRPRMHTEAFLPAGVPLADAERPVYLYASPTTARYLVSAGGNYETLLTPWRSLFRSSKRAYVETSRLDAIPSGGTSVLILPSALALNADERRQLIAFQASGGSILATWSLGARSADGAWLGHALMNQLFGVTVAGEVAPDSDERFLNVFGDSPLTVGYPAGQRIWLESTSEISLRLAGGRPAAYYMNWIREAASETPRAAVLFDEHGIERGHARWAVFGFPESSWGSQTDKLTGLLENTLHWLSRGTAVIRGTWPAPYRAAYIVEMDTEEGFSNARNFAEMMDAVGARATFYSLTSEALRYPYLVRDLARRHEIAFHGDVHDGFRAQSEQEQVRRLERMLADMRSILGDAAGTVGFRAPKEEYDRTTERLLGAKGFMHHAADPNCSDARLPFFSQESSSAPDKALVVLPRTQNDDISLRAGERFEGADAKLLRTMLADLDNVMNTGGMGLLSVHSQYFGKDSPLYAVMPAFLEKLAAYRKQVWTASANEVADWWRERERLRYRVSGTSDTFRLDVSVDGTAPLGRGAVIVTHRAAGAPVLVQPVHSASPRPALRALDTFRTAIVFDGIAPGSYSYFVKPALSAADDAPKQDLERALQRERVMAAVAGWARAWSAQDIDRYLRYYSSDFLLPAGMSREQWMKMRRAHILGKKRIEVAIVSPRVELAGDVATVRFRQIYGSDSLQDSDHKMLVLRRENGEWRIREEVVEG
jgi:peptidoglycan/xylan/chitin deacetylase (PgdA/CDA1 family)/ketosteroid isomerase-like protein